MLKKENLVAEADSVPLRNGDIRQLWAQVDYNGDKAEQLAELTVRRAARMQSYLARVMPEVFKLLFQRAPQPGEVDAPVSLAGGDGIEACMGDHASNEQRRPGSSRSCWAKRRAR